MLEIISRSMGSCVALAMAIPGIRFMLGNAQDSASETTFDRVIRTRDLIPGRPTIVPVMGQKQDAWSRSDREVIGRVWLVREATGESNAADGNHCQVRAFSTTCPHMGCQVQARPGQSGFACPCHRATFDVDGQRLPDPQTNVANPAPRGLDLLESRITRDEATGDSWVEVKYAKFKTGATQQVVVG